MIVGLLDSISRVLRCVVAFENGKKESRRNDGANMRLRRLLGMRVRLLASHCAGEILGPYLVCDELLMYDNPG